MRPTGFRSRQFRLETVTTTFDDISNDLESLEKLLSQSLDLPSCEMTYFIGRVKAALAANIPRDAHDWPHERCVCLIQPIYDGGSDNAQGFCLWVGGDRKLNAGIIDLPVHAIWIGEDVLPAALGQRLPREHPEFLERERYELIEALLAERRDEIIRLAATAVTDAVADDLERFGMQACSVSDVVQPIISDRLINSLHVVRERLDQEALAAVGNVRFSHGRRLEIYNTIIADQGHPGRRAQVVATFPLLAHRLPADEELREAVDDGVPLIKWLSQRHELPPRLVKLATLDKHLLHVLLGHKIFKAERRLVDQVPPSWLPRTEVKAGHFGFCLMQVRMMPSCFQHDRRLAELGPDWTASSQLLSQLAMIECDYLDSSFDEISPLKMFIEVFTDWLRLVMPDRAEKEVREVAGELLRNAKLPRILELALRLVEERSIMGDHQGAISRDAWPPLTEPFHHADAFIVPVATADELRRMATAMGNCLEAHILPCTVGHSIIVKVYVPDASTTVAELIIDAEHHPHPRIKIKQHQGPRHAQPSQTAIDALREYVRGIREGEVPMSDEWRYWASQRALMGVRKFESVEEGGRFFRKVLPRRSRGKL